MERDISDLVTELRGVKESLLVLSGEFEEVDKPSGVGNGTIHMMLFAVMKQLERIAEDIDAYSNEHKRTQSEG